MSRPDLENIKCIVCNKVMIVFRRNKIHCNNLDCHNWGEIIEGYKIIPYIERRTIQKVIDFVKPLKYDFAKWVKLEVWLKKKELETIQE